MLYIIVAILAFGILIIIHELGHFIMAKVNGVKVEEFSIGMGPKLLSKKGKETEYLIKLLPIGGYVKMLGEDSSVEDERSFSSKTPLRRMSIIIAGVIMNYILGILIFSLISFNFGYTKPILNNVLDNTPASQSGLQKGDEIVKIDDTKVFIAKDILVGLYISKEEDIDLTIKRNGEILNYNVIPLEEDGRKSIGIEFEQSKNHDFIGSVKQGLKETASCVSQTFIGLRMIFTGEANLKKDVGGPITIIKMTTATAKAGVWSLLSFMAFISVNLAVMNLLPIPALDGGWCVILLIELITRRKVPEKIVEGLNAFGFMLLMGLMLLVTVKDILFPIKF